MAVKLSIAGTAWCCLPIVAGVFGLNNAYIPNARTLPIALLITVIYFIAPLLILRAKYGKPIIHKSVRSLIGVLAGLVFFCFIWIAGFYSGIPGWITGHVGAETKRTYTVAQFSENPWSKTRWNCDYWLSFVEESGFLKERYCVPTSLYDGVHVGKKVTVLGKETWLGFIILDIQS